MVRRKNLFLKALEDTDVSILPRLIDDAKRTKCPYCPYYEKCGQYSESQEAQVLIVCNEEMWTHYCGYLIQICKDQGH
jgi:hypothetical protein